MKLHHPSFNILIFIAISLFLSHCKSLKHRNEPISEAELLQMTTDLILADISFDNRNRRDSSIHYIFPWVAYYGTIPPAVDHESKYDIMLPNYNRTPVRLVLPDGIGRGYAYYPSDSLDAVVHDTSTVLVSSPLLPTSKKGIYIKQRFQFNCDWYHYNPQKQTIDRIVILTISTYRIDDQRKVTYLESVDEGISYFRSWEVNSKRR